jgi:hypothetical protein
MGSRHREIGVGDREIAARDRETTTGERGITSGDHSGIANRRPDATFPPGNCLVLKTTH